MTQQNPSAQNNLDPAGLPEINNTDVLDDHTWPLKRAARSGGIAVGIFIVLSLMAWGAIDDIQGVWGALIGGVIGGAFMLFTVVVVLQTANTSPATTMGVVLGTWLLKLVLALIVVLAIRGMDFYSKPAFAVTVIVTMVAALATETYAVTKAQRLYVGA